MQIRPARASDLEAILAIHNQVVAASTASYEDLPSTLEQRQQWYDARIAQGYPVLVAVDGQQVMGYATFGEWRSRWGYRFTVEHTVHVDQNRRGHGIGRALLEALLPLARQMGKHTMIGAVDAENQASIRFHERLGFASTGRCRQVGYKFGRWLDLEFMQLILEPGASPAESANESTNEWPNEPISESTTEPH
jgi:L-amino acid N-acyltransferase YncA